MSRASWGSSSGDMSGMFVGLLDEDRRRIESSVQRDIQRSEEQQAADDNDMYDKWQNGLITDEDWLAYVRSRVRDTKGDPAQHAEWLKTWRDHRTAIEDAQLEARYEAGTLSIHKLIAHYGDRMASAEPHSPEYRDTQTRYYNLIDTRDSYYIEDEANRIINQIQRGAATSGDLRAFYQGMLGKVRRSSPLYRQLKDNINSISSMTGGSSGGGGGGGGGGSSSGSGGGGKRDSYSVAERAVVKAWKTGNVFIPGGRNVVDTVLDVYNMDTKDDTTVWYALKEDNIVIENLMQQALDNPEAKFLITPWGDRIPNTLQNRQLLMNQGLRGYDYRVALGHAQGRSVTEVTSARNSFVANTFVHYNDVTAEDRWAQVRQNAWESLEIASQDPNPSRAMQTFKDVGTYLEKESHNILGEPLEVTVRPGLIEGDVNAEKKSPVTRKYAKASLFPEMQLSPEMDEEMRYAIDFAQFLKNAPRLSPEELQHEASILIDARPESFWLDTSKLEEIVGTNSITSDPTGFNAAPTVGTGVIGKSFAQHGLMVSEEIRAQGGSGGGVPYTFVARPGATSPVAVPDASINDYLGVGDFLDGSTRGGWEKVGGKTEWVIRVLEPVDPALTSWFGKSSKGETKWLTASEYEKYGRDPKALGEAGYSLMEVPELAGWQTITDGDGTVWYKDPQDGHLYKDGPPFVAGISGPNFNYSKFVGEDGSIDPEKFRYPASTGRGFVAFWTEDVSPREAQEGTEAIMDNPDDYRINPSFYHKRDDHNYVSPEGITPDDIVGQMWSESDEQMNEWKSNYNDFYKTFKPEQLRHQAVNERAEIRRKAEVQEYIDVRFQTQQQQLQFQRMNNMTDTDLQQFATKQVAQAKALAGINFGNNLRSQIKTPQMREFEVPRVAAPPSPRPIAPVPVRAPRPSRNRTPAPPVFSGPRVGGPREFAG